LGKRSRNIRTLSGSAIYEREVYECSECRHSYAPMDEEMGVLPGEKLTRAVVRKVSYASARSSYAQASKDLKELIDVDVSPAECARVVEEEGARLERIQREREERRLAPVSYTRPALPAEIQCEKLVLQADATCVLTVEGEEHKSVYCGMAFGQDSRGRKEESNRPFITQKRYTGSAKNMEDFGQRLKALAYRMGMRYAESIAFIADGARCLWKWAEDALPKDVVFIQDFWHVCEHLADLAQELYGKNWKEKFSRWKMALRESLVDKILVELEEEHKRRRGNLRKKVKDEIQYLQNGRERMDYARFEKEGWPIGSGAIEATCKHLIKERFCITGAHWRRKNIGKLLSLRLSIFNNEWDQDWKETLAA